MQWGGVAGNRVENEKYDGLGARLQGANFYPLAGQFTAEQGKASVDGVNVSRVDAGDLAIGPNAKQNESTVGPLHFTEKLGHAVGVRCCFLKDYRLFVGCHQCRQRRGGKEKHGVGG